jgi:hypothetical protein
MKRSDFLDRILGLQLPPNPDHFQNPFNILTLASLDDTFHLKTALRKCRLRVFEDGVRNMKVKFS